MIIYVGIGSWGMYSSWGSACVGFESGLSSKSIEFTSQPSTTYTREHVQTKILVST
jgi:hypothetical protein